MLNTFRRTQKYTDTQICIYRHRHRRRHRHRHTQTQTQTHADADADADTDTDTDTDTDKKLQQTQLKDECHGNALRAHIRIGGHFMGRLVVEFVS